MVKRFLSRHKFAAACFVPCLLCTVWFLLDPSLNLIYFSELYHDDIAYLLLPYVTLYFPLLAYILSISTIIIACYLAFRFRARSLGVWAVCCLALFWVLPEFTEFPGLGQLAMIWSINKGTSYLTDTMRYCWLFDWLFGMIITLVLAIVICRCLEKRREKIRTAGATPMSNKGQNPVS